MITNPRHTNTIKALDNYTLDNLSDPFARARAYTHAKGPIGYEPIETIEGGRKIRKSFVIPSLYAYNSGRRA